MATSQMSEVIQLLRRTVVLRDGAGPTDGQLLEDYLSRRDEAALAALVRRHGPMVWGVCRRVLRNYHDAEDAFQATFLVLVRKAASIASRELLANWLYGVAHQTALKARATAARRKGRERQVTEMPEPAVAEQDLWRDLQPLLDEELSRLPDRYRVVIVLCDLEGKTRKEAAQQIGCPEGTVGGWLARARVMLAKRLAQRGVALSGGVLAAVLSQKVASAGVPTSVVSSTIKAASLFAVGQAAKGVISPTVAALTEGVLKTMLLNQLKAAVLLLLLLASVVGAGLALTYPAQAGGQKAAQQEGTPRTPAKGAVKQDAPKWKEQASLREHDGPVHAVAFAPGGKVFATGGSDHTVRLWDAASHKVRTTLKGHEDRVVSVAFSPDGKILASGSLDGTVKFWDLTNGKERSTLKGLADRGGDAGGGRGGAGGGGVGGGFGVYIAFAPDGKTLATACAQTVKLWDAATGKERATLEGHTNSVFSVTFSPDSKTLATAGGGDETVRLWDVVTGKEQATLQGHTVIVHAVAFAPGGKVLASGGGDGTVRLWDMTTGKAQATLQGPEGWVVSVAFAPDGKTLAAGTARKEKDDKFAHEVRLWDVAGKKEKGTLKGCTNWVMSLAFAPDGRVLAAASGYPWPVTEELKKGGEVQLWVQEK